MTDFSALDNAGLTNALTAAKSQQALFDADMAIGNDFNQGLKNQFDAVAQNFPIVKVIWSIFEDWHEVVYLLKNLALRLFALDWIEQFDVWLGPGQNGKGLLLRILRELFGTYYTEMKVAILCERGRSADSPSPAWMELRGCRLATIAEAEISQALDSATVKTLRDQSTIISSRDLRQSTVHWQPQFGMVICSNIKLKFTSSDGGIERSISVMPFKFKFTGAPTQPNHRRCDPALKSAASITALTPQLLYVLMKVTFCFLNINNILMCLCSVL